MPVRMQYNARALETRLDRFPSPGPWYEEKVALETRKLDVKSSVTGSCEYATFTSVFLIPFLKAVKGPEKPRIIFFRNRNQSTGN